MLFSKLSTGIPESTELWTQGKEGKGIAQTQELVYVGKLESGVNRHKD